ncbi:putative cyclic nucleotide-gated ion channel 13 isoform X2 [Mangifera indica]|uniref:putative cyclic nucleotide-gated ion channel 13 isoform X2 n=1 Tax=Mangifera indica TaxID=29780 RepID=UPI001CF9C97E|nr:putative cyclic nucleotide-gated ion channel 13 isoform X2 [Mangifera indica]
MNMGRVKFVRFEDWSSEKSDSERRLPLENGFYSRRIRPTISAVIESFQRCFEMGSEKIKSIKKPLRIPSHVNQSALEPESGKKILNPQSQFLQRWNKIFMISCVIALAIDPLFFYIPVIDGKKKCLNVDFNLEISVCLFRTAVDLFYILHIIFQFRTGFISPSSRVFGRGELIDDPKAIAKRYLTSYFVFDVLAILPLPQVVLLIIASRKGPIALITKETLKAVIICQYVPRVARLYPLYHDMIGAIWYLYSIERQDSCWRQVCEKDPTNCKHHSLYCEHGKSNAGFLNNSCPFIDPDDISVPNGFNFGIAIDALRSRVVEEKHFSKKFFYCFWWGLRNLSSLGQNLRTSTYVGEIFFAFFISISGLVLFALLIGNMQKYLQSKTVRVEEMRIRRRDTEQWMSHRLLPENLKDRIRKYEQYKWQETRGVEEDALIRNLPKDLRRDIKHHLCWDLLKKVPMFEKMDEQLLDAMCDRLKPVLCTEKSFILREGDPIEEMLFIMRGKLVSMTTNGGRTGFFNAVYLKATDFCGEALLTWALDPQSSTYLPISTRTVQALSEVEAFALMAEDLKFFASQYRRLHSKQLQHSFRFHSVQWRTWAACFIQAAWRRYCRKKLTKSLREAEDRLQDALATETGPTSLAATIYASKFAANLLRPLRQNGGRSTRLAQRLPPLIPQKPTEPDFTAKDF